jgi:hypothetical protein
MSHSAATARRGRQATDAPTPDAPTPDAPTPDAENAPDLTHLALMDEGSEELSDKDKAAFAGLTDKQRAELAEQRQILAIQGFTVAPADGEAAGFKQATTPTRVRRPKQLAMDTVAKQAYADWIAADRPMVWAKIPVITYFLDPDQVSDFRSLIKHACEIVNPETEGVTGVRARYGTEFVLSEKMATKIGKPDMAGKTVLTWAAVDKRKVTRGNANADE